MTGNIRILGRRLISRRNGLLEKFSVTRKRFDGRLQSLDREIYDTGAEIRAVARQHAPGAFAELARLSKHEERASQDRGYQGNPRPCLREVAAIDLGRWRGRAEAHRGNVGRDSWR
jgi:hypothetical protein